MGVTSFLIGGLALAGLQPAPELAVTTAVEIGPSLEPPKETERFLRFDRPFTLAGHRSHSSHSSHSSHRSSSGGGYYSSPSYSAPSYSPPSYRPPPTYTPPSGQPYPSEGSNRAGKPAGTGNAATSVEPDPEPETGKVAALKGNTKAFKLLVMRIQLALYSREYYAGPIDGTPGEALSASIRSFEQAKKLPVTGRLTDRLLDALGVYVP